MFEMKIPTYQSLICNCFQDIEHNYKTYLSYIKITVLFVTSMQGNRNNTVLLMIIKPIKTYLKEM